MAAMADQSFYKQGARIMKTIQQIMTGYSDAEITYAAQELLDMYQEKPKRTDVLRQIAADLRASGYTECVKMAEAAVTRRCIEIVAY